MRSSLVFLSSVFLIGCSTDFDPVWKINDLRILAIRAEPPEVLVPIGTTTFPSVKIDGLVVDPQNPDALFDWELWACTAERNGCEEATKRTRVHKAKTKLSEIQLDFILGEELYLAALKADPFKGFGGVPVIVELRISQSPEPVVIGIKRIVYGNSIPAAKQPNQNPKFAEIQLDGEPISAPVSISKCQPVELLPIPTDMSKENYLVATFSDPFNGRDLEEYLSFSFFATSGQLSFAFTGGKPSSVMINKKIEDVSSEWNNCDELGEPPPSGNATIWIVIRDDRGGVGWTSIQVTIQDN
ncbi:MAG: hypothetical protein V1754_01540 [Pseudomonadota bacterium]